MDQVDMISDMNKKSARIQRRPPSPLFISTIKNVDTIREIPHVKKIEGYESFYRIQIGDYRLGMEAFSNREVVLLRFLHRKDIYRYFPKRR